MLSSLYISNYALIDSLSIDFDDGFSVITGETGAGKSILLGALGFVLGERADSFVMLDESRKCVVEAYFDVNVDMIRPFLERNGLDISMPCVLRRELSPQKRSRAFINDTPVTLAQLKELGNLLVDIHSQHDSMLLVDNAFQLRLLDDAAHNTQLLESYQSEYHDFVKSNKELDALMDESRRGVAEYEFMSFQYEELKKADLQDNEYDELSSRLKMMQNAEEVAQILDNALSLLENSDDSVLSMLNRLASSLNRLKTFIPDISSLYERVNAANVELKDISYDIQRYADDIQYDDDTLHVLEERYDYLNRLMLKHHVNDYSALIEKRDELKRKVSDYENLDDIIAAKKEDIASKVEELKILSKKLHDSRMNAKEDFEKKVIGIIRQLAMPHAVFEIRCEQLDDFTSIGNDKIRFLFSANKGVMPDDIAKVASGGELSRLMLAVKSVAARNNYVPTLIFDEIDTGVSGEVASKLGSIMREMGESLQLVSITHLPQIASKAKYHFFVYKDSIGEHTRSCIKLLSSEERVGEIAKMLSNDKVSVEAVRAAEVLLNS